MSDEMNEQSQEGEFSMTRERLLSLARKTIEALDEEFGVNLRRSGGMRLLDPGDAQNDDGPWLPTIKGQSVVAYCIYRCDDTVSWTDDKEIAVIVAGTEDWKPLIQVMSSERDRPLQPENESAMVEALRVAHQEIFA